MDRLTALGTGNAAVTRCYNTCFLLELPQGYLLCDAGGGNGIPDKLFLRLKLCRVGCKSFPFDFLLSLIQPPLCPILCFGHTRSGW